MAEELNFMTDPGALLFCDSNQLQLPPSSPTSLNPFLKDLTLKNFSKFLTKLHSLPHPESFDAVESTIQLPAIKTLLPRYKKLPDKPV